MAQNRPLVSVAALPPVTVGFTSAPLGLVVLPHAHQGESCPWPRVKSTSPERLAASYASAWDVVDEWGLQSFPASDPPPNRP